MSFFHLCNVYNWRSLHLACILMLCQVITKHFPPSTSSKEVAFLEFHREEANISNQDNIVSQQYILPIPSKSASSYKDKTKRNEFQIMKEHGLRNFIVERKTQALEPFIIELTLGLKYINIDFNEGSSSFLPFAHVDAAMHFCRVVSMQIGGDEVSSSARHGTPSVTLFTTSGDGCTIVNTNPNFFENGGLGPSYFTLEIYLKQLVYASFHSENVGVNTRKDAKVSILLSHMKNGFREETGGSKSFVDQLLFGQEYPVFEGVERVVVLDNHQYSDSNAPSAIPSRITRPSTITSVSLHSPPTRNSADYAYHAPKSSGSSNTSNIASTMPRNYVENNKPNSIEKGSDLNDGANIQADSSAINRNGLFIGSITAVVCLVVLMGTLLIWYAYVHRVDNMLCSKIQHQTHEHMDGDDDHIGHYLETNPVWRRKRKNQTGNKSVSKMSKGSLTLEANRCILPTQLLPKSIPNELNLEACSDSSPEASSTNKQEYIWHIKKSNEEERSVLLPKQSSRTPTVITTSTLQQQQQTPAITAMNSSEYSWEDDKVASNGDTYCKKHVVAESVVIKKHRDTFASTIRGIGSVLLCHDKKTAKNETSKAVKLATPRRQKTWLQDNDKSDQMCLPVPPTVVSLQRCCSVPAPSSRKSNDYATSLQSLSSNVDPPKLLFTGMGDKPSSPKSASRDIMNLATSINVVSDAACYGKYQAKPMTSDRHKHNNNKDFGANNRSSSSSTVARYSIKGGGGDGAFVADDDLSISSEDSDQNNPWLFEALTDTLGKKSIIADLVSLDGRSHRSSHSRSMKSRERSLDDSSSLHTMKKKSGRNHQRQKANKNGDCASRSQRSSATTELNKSRATTHNHSNKNRPRRKRKKSKSSRRRTKSSDSIKSGSTWSRNSSSVVSHRSNWSYMSEASKSVAMDLMRLENQLAMAASVAGDDMNQSPDAINNGNGNFLVHAGTTSNSARRHVSRRSKDNKNQISSSSNSKILTIIAPPGKLGVVLGNKTNNLGTVVSDVRPRSILQGKLHPGDALVAIDDVDVSHMTVNEITLLMSQKADVHRTLTLITAR